ncbi:MAG TPA: hypothetical protein VL123_06835 [Candidatus Udaeobacter sp.]|jgi:hypothetical protein|nr:hypothetical protein [Candidatus Udaeobacter sp.]
MMSGTRWLIAIALLASLVSCTKKADNGSTESSDQAAERSQFVLSAEQKLADVDAGIDTLKAHVTVAGKKAQVEMKQDVDSLDIERQKVQMKLDAVKSASMDAWRNARDEFATALDSLDAKFDRARARLH